MSQGIRVDNQIKSKEWGCEFTQVSFDNVPSHIHTCLVKITDVSNIAERCIKTISSRAWISQMAPQVQRSYVKTVDDTVADLCIIFSNYIAKKGSSKIAADFGEIMVSMGSGASLMALLNHQIIPIAELWKPQRKQNEGFDFHTLCITQLINFGEAKFSASGSPHGQALPQISRFITEDKHFRDRVHLINIAPGVPINNLDNNRFGVVAAFSINARKPLDVLRNAAKSSEKLFRPLGIKSIYLVGVIHH